MKIDLTKKEELAAFLKGIFTPHVTALQGIMDQVPDALKPHFRKLKDELDTSLGRLQPTDQVPAALDAHYTLQSLCSALERLQEHSQSLMGRLADIIKANNEKATALQGYEDKEKSGDLITKAAAADLVEKAKTDAVAALRPTILAMRKNQVELAGLPDPGETVLALEEKDFTPRFDAAKTNIADLNKRGFKVGGRGAALIKDLAWLPASEYAGKMTAYEDVLGKAPTGGDPLLGGPGAVGGKPEDKVKARCW